MNDNGSVNIDLWITDWSGVISDDRIPVWESDMRLYKYYGFPTIGFEKWLPKTNSSPIPGLRNKGVEDSDEFIYDLYKKVYKEVTDEGILPFMYPDAKQVLQYFQSMGKQLAVLSGHPSNALSREASKYELSDFFGNRFFGESLNKADGLVMICEELGISKDRTIYTGDTIYDMRAAKTAGVVSVAVSTGYHKRKRLKKENPDFLIGSLSKMKNHIN